MFGGILATLDEYTLNCMGSLSHLTGVVGPAAGVVRLRVLRQRRVVVFPLRARVMRPGRLLIRIRGVMMI